MRQEHVEHVGCPLCGSDDPRPWAEEWGYHAVKCEACGLVYVTPRPTAERITEAITMGQHATEDGILDIRAHRQKRRVAHLQHLIRDMYRDAIAADRPLDWLDVGAGYGELVEALVHVLPKESKVTGIEPMQYKVDNAKSSGLPIENIHLSQINDTFDVISMMNVFSHIPNFCSFLLEVRKHMRHHGEVLIETGNGGDLCDRSDYPDSLYLPDHIVFAGEMHVEKFLSSADFELISKRKFRIDTPLNCAKNLAKRLLGRPSKIVFPYTSPFRTVFYRARAV